MRRFIEMGFEQYPRISAYIQSKGGVKRGALNKKAYDEGMESWNKLTPDEYQRLENEVDQGFKIFDALVTPTAIIITKLKTAKVIPVRDILWMYPRVVTTRYYFIPTTKTHNLLVMDRYGEYETLGFTTTGGFSKKTPVDDALKTIKSILDLTRKGIVYGYNDQVASAVETNLQGFAAHVDSNS